MAWIDGPLGLACLLAGLYHLVLLVQGRVPFAPALAHAVMGLGMAAMFVPAADPLPRPVWVAVFLAVAVWFAGIGLRDGTLLGAAGHHAVGGLAMIYMLQGHTLDAAPSGAMEHAHHESPSGQPLLMTAIALVFIAWFVADLARLLLPQSGAVAAVPVGAASAGSVGLDRHVVVPNAVMSAGMSIMFLAGMV
ncbi:DUF5134 domain-containing protein [Pseudonocardia sp. CA-107938]|uniref:DUF5134 domain-containing protein n=1 Tax=Pseudonocardia sp. CA-107938 TaxID=3240021 RepID=UPI003D8A430F